MENKCEENEIEITMNVADRLPELTEEDVSVAQDNIGWAGWFIGTEQGAVYNEAMGINLQLVSNRTVRCLSVGDHPFCYLILARMAVSFEQAGVEFQVDPYTVIRPVPPKEPEEQPTEPGLEVA